MDLGKLSAMADHRQCVECGMEFKTRKDGDQLVTAMMQHSDHLVVHQPEPKQWSMAYEKIQAKRQKTKEQG